MQAANPISLKKPALSAENNSEVQAELKPNLDISDMSPEQLKELQKDIQEHLGKQTKTKDTQTGSEEFLDMASR